MNNDFPYLGRVLLSDSFITTNPGVVIDVSELTPPEAFNTVNIPKWKNGRTKPRGVSVLTTGAINCRYYDDPEFITESFTQGITHDSSIRYIKTTGTTATGIIIKF